MIDLIVILILTAVIGGAGRYVYKEKKKGTKCIGCPMSGSCGSCSSQGMQGGCSCGRSED